MFERNIKRKMEKQYEGYQREIAFLFVKRSKTQLFAQQLVYMLLCMPIITASILFLLCPTTIGIVIFMALFVTGYFLFILWFIKNFRNELYEFCFNLGSVLHFKYYTTKGEAITSEDFEMIKKEEENLYEVIRRQLCQGHCYSVCFELLKILKRDRIMFVAVERTGGDDEESEEEKKNKYTMHVLYVKGDWCFDTHTQRQFKLDYILEKYHAKIYRTYQYEDVKEHDYDTFRDAEYDALDAWCKENDCYQEWRKSK